MPTKIRWNDELERWQAILVLPFDAGERLLNLPKGISRRERARALKAARLVLRKFERALRGVRRIDRKVKALQRLRRAARKS